ncbi:MAG: ABC transporter ATP-binding protein [Xanthobacteraceae bacterium]
MTLLSVRNLHVAYGKIVALDGVSLTVNEGEVVTLVGANGAGKSTLLKALMGLVPIGQGEVEFLGARTNGRPTYEMARLGIAYVPEGRGTLKFLTVRENLVLGASARPSSRDIERDLRNVLDRFPALAERIDQVAGTLSGGQQQMLVIARALMSRPRLMLLDEPSLGLAPLIARTIFEIIAELRGQGVTVLLVEQNAHAALKLASRAYVLETGRIVLEGSDLLDDPRVRRAYLGEIEAS